MSQFLTLHELEKGYGEKEQDIAQCINLMAQTNEIMEDLPWLEANQTEGHKTTIISELPEVYWTKLYEGVQPSKGKRTIVTDPVGMVESRSSVDARFAKIYSGDRLKQYRLSEAELHLEALSQEVCQTIFYGDMTSEGSKFNGLSMRYPTSTSPNVINAGGTTGAMTSIWVIAWGANSVHGLYPKGDKSGVDREDLGKITVADDDGGKYEALEEKFMWTCGLSVRDWRSVIRICNIPVANLGADFDDDDYINFRKLLIEAKNMLPKTLIDKARIYCNNDVLTALEIQSTDPKGVMLTYGQPFDAKPVTRLHGLITRRCDQILNTETVI